MIFKVQLSLATGHENRRVLVYDEGRTLRWEGDATEDVVELAAGDARFFCEGGLDEAGRIVLLRRVEEQGW